MLVQLGYNGVPVHEHEWRGSLRSQQLLDLFIDARFEMGETAHEFGLEHNLQIILRVVDAPRQAFF